MKDDYRPKRRGTMKSTKLIPPAMLLVGILGMDAIPLWVGGVFSKVTENPGSNYCKIEFPAIREETLHTNRPVLKDWIEDDIIEFEGPCGYDPLGKEEIEVQRAELRHEFREAALDEL
jgi:hypothetical protein